MRLRHWILLIHRWLGLASSVFISIVGATGAVLVWPGSNFFHRAAGHFHQALAIGQIGWWIVVASTLTAVVLEAGGIVLWWKRRAISVRASLGWRRALADLHHPVGALGLPLMLILSVSGVGMAFIGPQQHPELRRIIFNFHTSAGFPTAIKVLYSVGTLGFVVQGFTGVVMWWKPRQKASISLK